MGHAPRLVNDFELTTLVRYRCTRNDGNCLARRGDSLVANCANFTDTLLLFATASLVRLFLQF